MRDERLSRAQLENLHQIVMREFLVLCPSCRAEQDNNGLIAWCQNGHVYQIGEDDPRYNET